MHFNLKLLRQGLESIEISFLYLSHRSNRANMNQAAWLLTEEITECYRDIDELLVIGGVIWGNNTEDAFWKVVVRNDRVTAWIVPNPTTAPRQRLDDYLVSVGEIERVVGETIPVADSLKYEIANSPG